MAPSIRLVGLLLVAAVLIGLGLLAWSILLGFPPGVLQEWMDERALRRHLGIPSTFERIAYDGYPSMMGFGQREGLEISATYRLTDAQEDRFLTDAQARGWGLLPIPDEVRSRILFQGFNAPLDAERGVFLCRTVGNDVLRAVETRSCTDVDTLADMILGVLDIDRNALYAVVRAGY
jgi:hypothetical protein